MVGFADKIRAREAELQAQKPVASTSVSQFGSVPGKSVPGKVPDAKRQRRSTEGEAPKMQSKSVEQVPAWPPPVEHEPEVEQAPEHPPVPDAVKPPPLGPHHVQSVLRKATDSALLVAGKLPKTAKGREAKTAVARALRNFEEISNWMEKFNGFWFQYEDRYRELLIELVQIINKVLDEDSSETKIQVGCSGGIMKVKQVLKPVNRILEDIIERMPDVVNEDPNSFSGLTEFVDEPISDAKMKQMLSLKSDQKNKYKEIEMKMDTVTKMAMFAERLRMDQKVLLEHFQQASKNMGFLDELTQDAIKFAHKVQKDFAENGVTSHHFIWKGFGTWKSIDRRKQHASEQGKIIENAAIARLEQAKQDQVHLGEKLADVNSQLVGAQRDMAKHETALKQEWDEYNVIQRQVAEDDAAILADKKNHPGASNEDRLNLNMAIRALLSGEDIGRSERVNVAVRHQMKERIRGKLEAMRDHLDVIESGLGDIKETANDLIATTIKRDAMFQYVSSAVVGLGMDWKEFEEGIRADGVALIKDVLKQPVQPRRPRKRTHSY